MPQIVVIGSGVVGTATARSLVVNHGWKDVVVVERKSMIASHASSGNSALVHTGFDAPTGSFELEMVKKGCALMDQVCLELHVPIFRCGAIVTAWTDEQLAMLPSIVDKAHKNGVDDAKLLSAADVLALDPRLASHVKGGVWVPREGVVDAGLYSVALMKDAIANGAKLLLSTEAVGVRRVREGWMVRIRKNMVETELLAGIVINCAGLYGDLVERWRRPSSFVIRPRKGQFVLVGGLGESKMPPIVLPVPTARTKGVLVFPTANGQLAIGPTAEEQDDREKAEVDSETIQRLLEEGGQKVPAVRRQQIVGSYAGLRPASNEIDYIVNAEDQWITMGGIRSTGLSSSLALGEHAAFLCKKWADVSQNLRPASLTSPFEPTSVAQLFDTHSLTLSVQNRRARL